jgi:hypothetical protein
MWVPMLGAVGSLIDERFLDHRRRSTSVGGMAGALVAGGFFAYQFYGLHVLRWDLFAVIATMAVVKLSVLAWYRLRH